MRDTWDRRIERARELARPGDAASSLLTFYAELLALQKQLYEHLRCRSHWTATGVLDKDCAVLHAAVPAFVGAIAAHGPDALVAEARLLLAGRCAAVDAMLLEDWRSPSDRHFFAKAVLQPYAQWLADSGIRPVGRDAAPAENRCPKCGGAPQLSILESSSSADGAGRRLLCATCLSAWPFRRVVCAYCGEDDDRRLAYFRAPSLDHLRVDACDTCRHYLKSVDRTRLGFAVPLVDEVAGAPLDLWARDRGYEKIELNLVGL